MKREVYKKSQLVLTNSVGTVDDWDKKAIDKRQKDLAELAVKIWKLKP